jgi:hypothetical protein
MQLCYIMSAARLLFTGIFAVLRYCSVLSATEVFLSQRSVLLNLDCVLKLETSPLIRNPRKGHAHPSVGIADAANRLRRHSSSFCHTYIQVLLYSTLEGGSAMGNNIC